MAEREPLRSGEEECEVSLFDYSVENHLKVVDSITDLCGVASVDLNENEINRFSSSVTFLRLEDAMEQMIQGVKLCLNFHQQEPQSCVVKIHGDESQSFGEISRDFVMHVGGSVWALEWCPRVHENPDAQAKCEFLAVATHPPDSYSHKIGIPLSGRGIIQIWCIINTTCKKDSAHFSEKSKKMTGKSRKKSPSEIIEVIEPKKPRGRPRKHPRETTDPKKPSGRPRKKSTPEFPVQLDGDVLYIEALSVQYPEDSAVSATPLQIPRETSVTETTANNENSRQVLSLENANIKLQIPRETSVTETTANNENSRQVLSVENANIKLPVRRKKQKTEGTEENCKPLLLEDSESVGSVPGQPSSSISEDIALPRVVLCLAHNGKVAWDIKWRPSYADDSLNKHTMGYLAVLLGNGSLEVWDVPMPQATSAVYLSSKKAATDPHFVKLASIFKCSNLKCGDTKSIPLTVEWSTSGNPDFLLAGCHDGTVALWKFSTLKSSEDTRPLLFFSADTAPIRAIAWALGASDQESANVVATTGHGGLKFWDLREPFRPLWDLHPVPRFIYSLDWLQDPRCVLLSFDDGTLRILSLVKIAYDVPATGKPSNTKQQRLSIYNCASFPIWSIQVSRLTGVAAYCTADGPFSISSLLPKLWKKAGETGLHTFSATVDSERIYLYSAYSCSKHPDCFEEND